MRETLGLLLLLAFAKSLPWLNSPENYKISLFNSADDDGDGYLSYFELEEEYSRSRLPLTPGNAVLLQLYQSNISYEPFTNGSDWISL